jgi:hypothetical protein
MILRRVIEHVRKQEWTAVFLDFVIVVVGVLMAFQITAWNEARSERERADGYLSRIRSELDGDLVELQRHRDFWGQVAAEGYAAIRYVERGERAGATDWELLRSFLNASQSWQFGFIDSTYSELRSAGELGLIADADLRAALADYYIAVAARRGGGGHYSLLPEYRKLARSRIRSDIMQYYWGACFGQGAGIQEFLDCPLPEGVTDIAPLLEQLATDPEIIETLRFWIDMQRMAVELADIDIGRIQALIDQVDALK